MNSIPTNQIFNSRQLNTPIDKVYNAFSNPELLKLWWGPHGFTNTIHEFDLKPGGNWILTMHGPEKGNYENSTVFKIVEPQKLISWTRKSQPYFDMDVAFEKIDETITTIFFRLTFDSAETCEKMRPFVEPKNEENFDRLESLLAKD